MDDESRLHMIDMLDDIERRHDRVVELIREINETDRYEVQYKPLLNSVVGAEFAFSTSVMELRKRIAKVNTD